MESSEANPAAVLYHKTPNKSMRKKYALEWSKLNDEEKMILRSKRARQGLRCDICGSIGYYRENCPNACVSPPKTPDSMDSTPPSTPPPEPVGLGVFWGSDFCEETHPWNNDDTPRGKFDYLKKVDVNVVRPKAKIEEKKLQVSDSKLGSYEFFTEADEGYARTYPELTLHQVMRRLMRLLEKQLYKNAENLEAAFDTTLLHPPFEKDRDTFYPEELTKVKEYKEYFLAKELKKDRKLMYKHQASLRPPDDLDPLFRGGSVDDRFIFHTNPKAGQSMHGKNTWKSVLSHSDDLASSDPMMAKKQAKIDKLFHDQSKWIQMQQRSMTHRNDRYEHLVNILKNELAQEHKREAKSLMTSKHGTKSVQLELWLERLESVDTIMNCVKLYNFTSGLEEADFLMFCFDRWKQTIRTKVIEHGGGASLSALKAGDSGKEGGSATSVAASSSSSKGSGKSSKGGAMNHNKMISSSSPYHADMVAINEQEKKTRKIRDKFLADAKISREKEAQLREQLMAKEMAEAAAKKAAQSAVSWKKDSQHQPQPVLQFAPSVGSPLNTGRTGTSGPDHDSSKADEGTLTVTVVGGGSLTSVPPPPPSLSRGYSQSAISTVSNSPNPSRRPSLKKMSSYGSDLTGFNSSAMNSTADNSPSPSRTNSKVTLVTPADLVEQSVEAAMKFTEDMKKAAEIKKQHKKLMTTSRAIKNYTVVHRKHPREIDDEKIARATQTFVAADLKDHIRKGRDTDLACIAPSLIPIPDAFDGDGRHPMSSYTAENIVWKVKKNMIIGDLGYMPRSMLPLYVRNTLIEKNGTSKGGDQTYDMMSTDRRYTHYMGRPLNRFEEFSNEELADVSQTGSSGYGTMIKSRVTKHSINVEDNSGATRERLRKQQLAETRRARTAELEKEQKEQQREARHRMREERRLLQIEMDKAKETPLSSSLVRMVFKNPEPDLKDLNFLDEY